MLNRITAATFIIQAYCKKHTLHDLLTYTDQRAYVAREGDSGRDGLANALFHSDSHMLAVSSVRSGT